MLIIEDKMKYYSVFKQHYEGYWFLTSFLDEDDAKEYVDKLNENNINKICPFYYEERIMDEFKEMMTSNICTWAVVIDEQGSILYCEKHEDVPVDVSELNDDLFISKWEFDRYFLNNENANIDDYEPEYFSFYVNCTSKSEAIELAKKRLSKVEGWGIWGEYESEEECDENATS